jgi:Family of unknown function (DUF6516)
VLANAEVRFVGLIDNTRTTALSSRMKAALLLRERLVLAETAFAEIVIWRVPAPVKRSRHGYKYRMALVRDGICVLRYDNEAGKGDHRHVGKTQRPYRFIDIDRLQSDFWADVEAIMKQGPLRQ